MNFLIKAENAMLLFLTLFIYFFLFKFSFWVFLILLFVPDFSMIGYLINTKVGAYLYNMIHHLFLSIVLLIIFFTISYHTGMMVSLIWMSHIFMDRVLGFGLKYIDDFKHTHLDVID